MWGQHIPRQRACGFQVLCMVPCVDVSGPSVEDKDGERDWSQVWQLQQVGSFVFSPGHLIRTHFDSEPQVDGSLVRDGYHWCFQRLQSAHIRRNFLRKIPVNDLSGDDPSVTFCRLSSQKASFTIISWLWAT